MNIEHDNLFIFFFGRMKLYGYERPRIGRIHRTSERKKKEALLHFGRPLGKEEHRLDQGLSFYPH